MSVASVQSNKSIAVTNPKIPGNSSNSVKLEFRLSQADHNSQKDKKRKAESDMETDLMVKLKEKLNSRKDEEGLSTINKLEAKHETDNIMFKFQLQQDEENSLSPNHQMQNRCASEFIRSPPPTPRTPVEASSPIYNL